MVWTIIMAQIAENANIKEATNKKSAEEHWIGICKQIQTIARDYNISLSIVNQGLDDCFLYKIFIGDFFI